MAYICHCDICDARIEKPNEPHQWTIGEMERTSLAAGSMFPPYMLICDACFPMFEEEVKNLIKRIQRWKEHKYG